MRSGGTQEEILLSITDEDIREACRKYPENNYNFIWATGHLIEIRNMISKAYLVLDALSMDLNSILGRVTEEAAEQFLAIFNQIKGYSRGSEPGAQSTSEHDKIVGIARNYIQTVTTRGRWNSDNQGSTPNSALDAYLLALQLEQQANAPPDVAMLKEDLETLKGRAKQIEESLGASSGKEAVRKFGEYYNVESDEQVKSRDRWLILGFISVILLAAGVVLFSIHPSAPLFASHDWTDPHVIGHVVEKLLILSIFAFLARFGFHQYSIRMHLLSSYRQKAVLGNTFELLLNAETMADRRDLIMTEVLGSLATFIPTGYIRKDSPELHPLAEIAKIIGSIKGKEGK
jgi:hypothetical protein